MDRALATSSVIFRTRDTGIVAALNLNRRVLNAMVAADCVDVTQSLQVFFMRRDKTMDAQCWNTITNAPYVQIVNTLNILDIGDGVMDAFPVNVRRDLFQKNCDTVADHG